MINKQLLLDSCNQLGIPMTEEAAQKMDRYAELLIEWNQKMNLTAIVQPDDIVVKHFVDSLLLLKAVELPPETTMIDVGTGAGFPSLPIHILRGDMQVMLLDSAQKKLGFLQEVCKELELSCKFTHARAEDGGQDTILREKYDVATARAVASLRNLAEYCLPYVKIGGRFIALKGGEPEEEIQEAKNAISTMGGQLEITEHFTLPDGSKRSIIVIKKISQTPPQFPRSAAKIAKKPLI